MATIYELQNDFQEVMDLILSGEYDEETLKNTLECIHYEIEEKADGYAKVMKNIESDIAGIKAEEERLAQKRKAMENSVKRMKADLQEVMIQTGKKKFKTEFFSFSIQKNPAKVELIDGKEIPADYLIEQEPKVDTAGIKKVLQGGECLDFAILTQGESLRIR